MMKSACKWLGLVLALASAGAAAQTGTVPLDSGTPPTGLTNSNITEVNGNVGIGTTSPGKALTVIGSADIKGTIGYFADETKLALTTGTVTVSDSTADAGIAMQRTASQGAGTVWFGPYITLPAGNYTVQYRVKVASNTSPHVVITLDAVNAVNMVGAASYGHIEVHPSDFRSSGDWETFSLPITVANNDSNIEFRGINFVPGITDFSLDYVNVIPGDVRGYSSPQLTFVPNGNVGIGTTAPGAKLEVSGSVLLTSGSGGSITYQDGTTQTTAWTGTVCGGDYAESVDASGDRKKYEPGDVLVIDPETPSKFLRSSEPYSRAVAGVYSTKPGVTGRRQTTPKSADEIPMAVIGIVPVKVSAENGPIRPSDLLVASSHAGYAMKGTDSSRMLGAIIGKAMGNLESGTGVIEVLVTLQ
jgi:hypothetical protein